MAQGIQVKPDTATPAHQRFGTAVPFDSNEGSRLGEDSDSVWVCFTQIVPCDYVLRWKIGMGSARGVQGRKNAIGESLIMKRGLMNVSSRTVLLRLTISLVKNE